MADPDEAEARPFGEPIRLRPSGANLAFRYVTFGILMGFYIAIFAENGLRHPADLLFLAIAAPGVWVLGRTHMLGVRLADDHAVVFGEGRNRRFSRDEVTGAVVRDAGDLLGRRDLLLETVDGLRSTPLITFSNRDRLEAQAATIAQWAGSPDFDETDA